MCSWHTDVASFSLAVGALSVMWPFALGRWVQGSSQQMGHATQDPDPDRRSESCLGCVSQFHLTSGFQIFISILFLN